MKTSGFFIRHVFNAYTADRDGGVRFSGNKGH